MSLILFILISKSGPNSIYFSSKSEPNSTIYLGFNINGPISTFFILKWAYVLQVMKLGFLVG